MGSGHVHTQVPEEMAKIKYSEGLRRKPMIHCISHQVPSGTSIHPDIVLACEPPVHM